MLKKIVLCCAFLVTSYAGIAQSVQDYIDAHFQTAQNLSKLYKMPASIVLGVAIHESAAGKSKIARYLNNHFGVKGSNSSTEIRSAYKGYDSIEDSYQHFADFLLAKPAYNKLFDLLSPYDYKNWAKGIQRGGYARSRTWASQVIALINKYELYQYDDRPVDYIEPLRPVDSVAKLPAFKTGKPVPAKRIYIVKKGDNLNRIAKLKGTTAVMLMKKNNLKSAALQPGQKLKY